MSADALCEEIRRLGPWNQDIQVAPGIWTGEVVKDVVYPPELGRVTMIRPELWAANFVREVYPGGLNGRSFLDCACNGGGYLFAAAERGAGRCFGLDVRDHWIDQARFVARHTGARGIDFTTADLHTLPQMELEPFDVTLFMGIFYHLPDPVASLRMVADRTKELLVLNTAYLPGKGHALELSLESQTMVMSGVHRLAWMPTSEHVLREILRWCGFPHVRTTWRRPPEGSRSHRIELLAAREASTFAHFDVCRPDALAPPRASLLRRLRHRLWR
jgi:2-polyprenyl-3-methyl-5-hydroxy-6-metoxy-1,4-benzoquinol methylase